MTEKVQLPDGRIVPVVYADDVDMIDDDNDTDSSATRTSCSSTNERRIHPTPYRGLKERRGTWVIVAF